MSGDLERFKCPAQFAHLIKDCAYKDFAVYCKRPFAGPQAVIKYLGQYTHRIAISNWRLVKVENERVYFKVRDRENPKEKKIMSLHVKEFMRRFLLHILPKGFVRIRHFGLLANRYKRIKVDIIRKLQGLKEWMSETIEKSWKDFLHQAMGINPGRCPSCAVELHIDRVFLPTIGSG